MVEQLTMGNTRLFFQGATCSVDPQGRLVFPKPWRLSTDDVNTMFILAPGLDRGIDVYTPEVFKGTFEKALLAPKDAFTQNYLSIYANHCQQITLDKQGRFAVAEKLRNYANLSTKAEFVGAITYGRIFNPSHWEEIKMSNKPQVELS